MVFTRLVWIRTLTTWYAEHGEGSQRLIVYAPGPTVNITAQRTQARSALRSQV